MASVIFSATPCSQGNIGSTEQVLIGLIYSFPPFDPLSLKGKETRIIKIFAAYASLYLAIGSLRWTLLARLNKWNGFHFPCRIMNMRRYRLMSGKAHCSYRRPTLLYDGQGGVNLPPSHFPHPPVAAVGRYIAFVLRFLLKFHKAPGKLEMRNQKLRKY